MFNKKAVTAVVAISLLLLVSLGVYFLVANWFESFESSQRSDFIVDQQTNVVIESLMTSNLYAKGDTQTIISVEIQEVSSGDELCFIEEVEFQDNSLDISECSLQDGIAYRVLISLPNGLHETNLVALNES